MARPDTPTLADLVKAGRAALRFSQEDLAQRANVTRGAISQIESGETKRPTAAVFVGLRRALAIDYDTLFEATGLLPPRAGTLAGGLSPLEQRALDLARAARSEDNDWLMEQLGNVRDLLTLRQGRPKAQARTPVGTSR